MFWNKESHTVRFKICVTYAGLLLSAALISFICVYFFQAKYTYGLIENKISVFCDEFNYKYLTLRDIKLESIPCDIASLPPFVTAALKQYNENQSIIYSSEIRSDIKTFCVITCDNNENLTEFTITPFRLTQQPCESSQAKRILHLEEEFNEDSYGEEEDQVFFLLLAPDERLLAKSFIPPAVSQVLKDFTFTRKPRDSFLTVNMDNASFKLKIRLLHDGNLLVIGANLDHANDYLSHLVYVFIIISVVTLIVGITGGWLISALFVKGINRIRVAADKVFQGDFSQRVTIGGEGREIDSLAKGFNRMTENTEHILHELKNITNDIAHDLRTPLTALRGQAEIAVQSQKTDELPCIVIEGCDRLLAIINTMLEISQAEAGISHAKNDLDFSFIVNQTVEIYTPTAENKNISLHVSPPLTPVIIHAQKTAMQRLTGNLVDNAIKFTPGGGIVSILLNKTNEYMEFSVADSGPGIPVELRDEVFKRFFRMDESRSLPGNGLGLCLVKAIVQSYNGTISIEDNPGGGTVFRIRFPIHDKTT